MKKLVFLLVCLPLFAVAQKNVLNALRVFPKVDRIAEFEKAMAAHAQKYHTGDWKWRIYQIQSGDDFGGYHITEGPNSWEDFDKRGTLGAEHMTDWNKNIAPHLTERGSSMYGTFDEELSNVAMTDYSDWIAITRFQVRPGYASEMRDWVASMKKVWVENKIYNAVYRSASSGPMTMILVRRYKNGLKERMQGAFPNFREAYEKIHGRDSWNKMYVPAVRASVESATSEMLMYRADLSSK